MLNRGQLKRTPLKKKGPQTTLWETFRDKKAEKDRDEEGLIRCQDTLAKLPHCGLKVPSPDLHHLEGREARPDLYFANHNLVWLVRKCHDKVHDRNTSSTNTETSHDQKRQVEETPRRTKVFPVQRRSSKADQRNARAEIYSDIPSRYAAILEREEEKTTRRHPSPGKA